MHEVLANERLDAKVIDCGSRAAAFDFLRGISGGFVGMRNSTLNSCVAPPALDCFSATLPTADAVGYPVNAPPALCLAA
jgi:hypothetical protein